MRKLPAPDELWPAVLTGKLPHLHAIRRLFKLLPGAPRCKLCLAPMGPPSGPVLRLIGKRPARLNPRYCNACEKFLVKHRGGAEMELSLLFADVRGSTSLAEGMSPARFSELMNRFYVTSSAILIDTDAFVDKMVGDEVVAWYVPKDPDHPARAVRAAEQLLLATGHADLAGPWVPVGVGVHTGTAYVGVVGSADTVTDLTALGDAVNVTARLASTAAAGEILVSETAYAAAGIVGDHERRQMEIRGHAAPVDVRILRVNNEAALITEADGRR
jgi:adenylate cyclase